MGLNTLLVLLSINKGIAESEHNKAMETAKSMLKDDIKIEKN